MCGIGLSLCACEGCDASRPASADDRQSDQTRRGHQLDEATLRLVRRRGPDHWGVRRIAVTVRPGGSPSQPPSTVEVALWAGVLSLRGAGVCGQPIEGPSGVLCFNGEIYEGLDVAGPELEADTATLLRSLASCRSNETVAALVSSLRGPWAFVYLCRLSRQLFVGRDIFGRRCLLIRRTACGGFELTSVACPPAAAAADDDDDNNGRQWEEIPALGVYVYDLAESTWSLLQWDRTPSGGLSHSVAECNALAGARPLTEKLKCPITVPLRRQPALLPAAEVGGGDPGTDTSSSYDALQKAYSVEVDTFRDLLEKSIRRRLDNVSVRFSGIPIGILFSGGIDCTVMAALALKAFPHTQFELINVAFEHRDAQGRPSFNSPDRLTSIEAFDELRSLDASCVETSPRVRLVCVDVPYDELQLARAELHVPRLVYPMKSVLDDSIGFALWFAARGRGYDFVTNEAYQSRARVLLLGMGADEQLGGYSRHAASFKDRSWTALADCIATDIDRISWRNLGRDDRVLADLGKESRTPYLDEELVSYLNGLPLDAKMRLDLPRGFGDKLVLRLLAHKLSLEKTARRPKRALQFGSKIAHADPKRAKGHLECNRLRQPTTCDR